MITLLLALIDAKLNIDFHYLYLGTITIDMSIICLLCELFRKEEKRECEHVWETIKEVELKDQHDYHLEYKYVLQCKKCGEIKEKSL